jgi:transposase
MTPTFPLPDAQAQTTGSIAAWIGLDWADQQHVISLYDVASGQTQMAQLRHSAETLQQWVADLRSRYGGAQVAVVLEQARGSVWYALMSHDFLVLYPVNPESLANYRKTFFPSRAKNDPSDAALLQEMVRKNPERFRAWWPEDVDTRALRLLTQHRRRLVDRKTALTNQLTSLLKGYYPQALDWAGALDKEMACAFFQHWPTLRLLQNAKPARLRQFWKKHSRLTSQQMDQRLEAIDQAHSLTDDSAVVEASALMVQALVAQLAPLLEAIEQFEHRIAERFQHHPDRGLFESFPGAGAAVAPRLLVALGADRQRWQAAEEIQRLSGIAPVTEQSGQSRWVHWRSACPKFLRQTFQEFANWSLKWCRWAKTYYLKQRDRGNQHQAAVRALAYKWIRIIFRCWKQHTPYNDSFYVDSLRRRGSPLVGDIEKLIVRAGKAAACGKALSIP